MDAQHLSFYKRFLPFYQNKDHNVRQIRFHVCIKTRCCKGRVCKRKTLSRHPNIYSKGHYQKVNLVAVAEGYEKQR